MAAAEQRSLPGPPLEPKFNGKADRLSVSHDLTSLEKGHLNWRRFPIHETVLGEEEILRHPHVPHVQPPAVYEVHKD